MLLQSLSMLASSNLGLLCLEICSKLHSACSCPAMTPRTKNTELLLALSQPASADMRSRALRRSQVSCCASVIDLSGIVLRRPLHVAALIVSVAAVALTLRLTAEQWNLADLRLPLFGPRRAVAAGLARRAAACARSHPPCPA